MKSLFSRLEDRMFAEAERVFGESFRFLPYVAAPGGGRRQPDTARQQRDVTAIYEAPNFKSTAFGSEARGSLPATMERTSLSIDVRQFPDGARPERFDRFRRTANGDLFEVSQIERDAEGRLKVWIKSLGREQLA